MAGSILMPADPDDLAAGDSDGDGLRAMCNRPTDDVVTAARLWVTQVA